VVTPSGRIFYLAAHQLTRRQAISSHSLRYSLDRGESHDRPIPILRFICTFSKLAFYWLWVVDLLKTLSKIGFACSIRCDAGYRRDHPAINVRTP
jgi:hypothetical protein